jgi:predicted nucleic acid-binding protein
LLIQRNLVVVAARDMVDLLAPLRTIEWVGPELHDRSLVHWAGIATRHLNFVDVVSFACMRELKISRAFTGDRHVVAQCFEIVG